MSYVLNSIIDRYKCPEDNSANMLCMGVQAPPGPAPTTYAIPITTNHIPMDMGHDIALHHFNATPSNDNTTNSHHNMANNMNMNLNHNVTGNNLVTNHNVTNNMNNITHTGAVNITSNLMPDINVEEPVKKTKKYRDPFKKKDYLCEDCGKQLSSSFQLKNHKRTHTGEKPFICDSCGKAFISTGSLKSHLRKVHDVKNPKLTYQYAKSGRPKSSKPVGLTFNCDICAKEFQKRKNLSSHRRLHFPKRHFCTFCNKAFHKKTNLSLHLNIHLGRKPYVCKVCNKSFCAKSNLTSHEKIHSTEKPFQCNLCEKSFISKLYLKYHCRNHQYTDRKDNYCLKCKRQFSNVLHYNTHLVNHHRQNPKTKPYACSKCRISYSQRNSLKEHLKKYHPETQGDFKALDPTKCTSALKMVKESFDLEKLTEKVIESGVFLCKVCFASYSKKLLLDKHISLKHPKYEEEVEQVNKRLDKENLRKKNITLPKMLGYVCKLCLIPYTMKIHLMKHISKIHPELYKEEMPVPKNELDNIVGGINKNHTVATKQNAIEKEFLKDNLIQGLEDENTEEHVPNPTPSSSRPRRSSFVESKKDAIAVENALEFDKSDSDDNFGANDDFDNFDDSASDQCEVILPDVSKADITGADNADDDVDNLYADVPNELQVFYCDNCLSCYSMKIHLKKHYAKMHPENTSKIEQLTKEIEAEKLAKKKPKVTKKKENLIVCDLCSKVFPNRVNLKLHYNQVHIGDRLYNCDSCTQTFKTKKHLRRHQLVHSDERAFTCETCDTKFKYRDGWKRHIKRGCTGKPATEKKRRGRPPKKVDNLEKLDSDDEQNNEELDKFEEEPRSKRKTREPKKVIVLEMDEDDIDSAEITEESDDEYMRNKRRKRKPRKK